MKFKYVPLRSLLFYLLTMGALFSNAQKLQYETGKEETINELTRYNLIGRLHTIFVEDSDNYYINRTTPVPGIKVDQVDKKTHAWKAFKEIPVAGFKTNNNTYFYGIYKSSSGFVAFMSTYDKNESFVTCYQMDNNFKLLSSTEVLRSSNSGRFVMVKGINEYYPYNYSILQCKQGFIIYGQYRYWVLDEKLPIAFVSNAGLKIWQNEIENPENSNRKFLNAHIDEDNNLFLVTQLRKPNFLTTEKDLYASGGETRLRKIFIHQIDPVGKVIKSESLPMEKMFDSYSNFSCEFDTVADRLNITGQYDNPNQVNGIFHFNYTLHPLMMKSGNALTPNRKLYSDRPLEKEKLKFKCRYDTKDGGYTLVFEEHDSIDPYYVISDIKYETKFKHHYNSLLVLHINNNGQLVWSKVISKLTEGIHTEYLNPKTFMVNDVLYALMNVDLESIEKCEKKNGYYKQECCSKNISALKVIGFDDQGNIVASESILPDPQTKYLCNLPRTKLLPDQRLEISFDLVDKKGTIISRKKGYLSLLENKK